MFLWNTRKTVPLAAAALCLLTACTSSQSSFTTPFSVVGTQFNQYFAIDSDSFQKQLNETLSDSAPPLEYLDSDSERSVYLSKNGETWKILLQVFTADDVSDAVEPSGDPAEWVGYVHEVKLSLYAASEQEAQENGAYIRALLTLFTPGAEEEIEDVLGIYGDPKREAILSDSMTRATYGTVSYTYAKDDYFLVTPYDESLLKESKESSPAVIRPGA